MKKKKQKSKPKQRRPKTPTPKPKPPAAAPITAIVSGKERVLKASEIQLLKNTITKNLDDTEFQLFMLICKKKKLDPFTKQVYAIKWPRRNQPAEMVIIVGIGGYRSMAARSHKKDFGGTSGGVLTWPEHDWPENRLKVTPAGKRIPATATVEAFRKSGAKGSATVWWEEFAPKDADLTDTRSDFWNRMPKHMLIKCAEAHALRKVFPDLSDIYSEEEMTTKLNDLTPSGRQMSKGGVAPSSGQILDSNEVKNTALRNEAIETLKAQGRWCSKHNGPSMKCPADDHSDAENEAFFDAEQVFVKERADENERVKNAKNITPTQKPAPPNEPVWPKSSGKPEAKPETKEEVGAVKAKTTLNLADLTLLNGTLHNVVTGVTSTKHVPFTKLKVGNNWYTCWSKTIAFQIVDQRYPLIIEFYIDKRTKCVEGLRRLGLIYYEPDGRTPKTS